MRIIRAERPQVIITYGDDSKFYPHPDHIRVHEISVRRSTRPAIPTATRTSGEPWQPSKLYYTGWSAPAGRRRCTTRSSRLGEESPYTTWFEREASTRRETHFTTFVDVGDFLHQPREPRCSRTARRSTPTGSGCGCPTTCVREVFPWEEFVLARSLVDTGVAEGDPEDDLFAGLRAEVPSPRRCSCTEGDTTCRST